MYLKLENITKQYDGKMAVEDLCLEVPKGVIYGMIGPNGAGKTTTIRMVMNIIAPDSGRVLIDGREADVASRDRIGYLPEERGLYKKFTLREVITYLAELKGCPRPEINRRMGPWLKRMDLQDYELKKVEELSKGMAQKLQFITTVLHGPDIVILDEIFSGLDPINIEVVKDALLELKRNGTTILFSTHVMEQAEKLCDHICMISRGHKVLDGRIADIKARFGRNSVQMSFEGDGHFVKNLPGVKKVLEFNTYVELQLTGEVPPHQILKAAVERLQVNRFEVMAPSLYDIFIEEAKVDPAELQTGKGGPHA
jgi:ABC-2 type transport system ATP-binding protein